jgi:hypothetical protein
MRTAERFARFRWLLVVGCAIAAVPLARAPAAAQVLQGRVVGASGEGPVATALVRLVDEEGEQLAISIADSAGVYRLEAPAPGTYRLQAERLGYQDAETPLLRAIDPEGVFDIDLVMSAAPVEVQGLTVRVPEDDADQAVQMMIGLNPTSLRFRPVRFDALADHVARAHTLVDVMRWEYAPAVLVRETFDGPCFEYRVRNCLPVYLNSMRLNRDFMPDIPLDMVYRIQVITPTDGSVVYPSGAVLLYTEAWLR